MEHILIHKNTHKQKIHTLQFHIRLLTMNRIVYNNKKSDPTTSSGYYFSPLPFCCFWGPPIHCLCFLSTLFLP